MFTDTQKLQEVNSLLHVDGFVSRESDGSQPVFELIAKKAEINQSTSKVDMSEIEFILFRNGSKESRVVAGKGVYFLKDKTVELYDKVSYYRYIEPLRLTAGRVKWNNKTSVLRCEDDIEGKYKNLLFNGSAVELTRGNSNIHVWKASVIDTGIQPDIQ